MDIIAKIMAIIIGVGNSTNYFQIQNDILKRDMERRIMSRAEKEQRVHWRDLEQRDAFINIVRNSNHMTESELRESLVNIFQDIIHQGY